MNWPCKYADKCEILHIFFSECKVFQKHIFFSKNKLRLVWKNPKRFFWQSLGAPLAINILTIFTLQIFTQPSLCQTEICKVRAEWKRTGYLRILPKCRTSPLPPSPGQDRTRQDQDRFSADSLVTFLEICHLCHFFLTPIKIEAECKSLLNQQ